MTDYSVTMQGINFALCTYRRGARQHAQVMAYRGRPIETDNSKFTVVLKGLGNSIWLKLVPLGPLID